MYLHLFVCAVLKSSFHGFIRAMVPKEAQKKTKKTEFSIPAETSKSENHQNKAAAPQINHCRSGLVAHAEGASWHLCAGSRLAIDRVIAFLGQLLLVAQSEWKKGATKRLQKLQENPCKLLSSSIFVGGAIQRRVPSCPSNWLSIFPAAR